MLKEGRNRAFRNIPVGWITQAIHSTDRTEIFFRVAIELILMFLGIQMALSLNLFSSVIANIIVGVLIIHSCNWFLTGNFWVYMLDSFKLIKNPGINSIIKFIQLTKNLLVSGDYCESILIYGSMCRCEFHIRSDLDLRVVRRTDSWKGLLALPIAFLLRVYSFFVLIPVDLQVVDSYNFLSKQMRKDEKPIIVFQRKGTQLKQKGLLFQQVVNSPKMVLKKSINKL